MHEPFDPLPRPRSSHRDPGAVLIQYGSWNVQGKNMDSVISILDDFLIDTHILSVQEVGPGTSDSDCSGSSPEVQVTQPRGGRQTVLQCHPPGCFRSLGLILDDDGLQSWSSAHVGHSHLVVLIKHSLLDADVPLVIVSLHLPHSGRPAADFEAACASLHADLTRFADSNLPTLLLGDFNQQIHLPGVAGDRAALLDAVLQSLGLGYVSQDSVPTWRDRRVDHIVCNHAFACKCLPIGSEACRWAEVSVLENLRAALGVDHRLLLHESMLRPSHPGVRKRRSRAAQFRNRPCRMALHSPEDLQRCVYAHMSNPSVGFLETAARTSTRPAPSRKYVDPPAVRDLCLQRSVCFEPERRQQLSLAIYRARGLARRSWRKNLVLEAACGDWQARRMLLKQVSTHTASRRFASTYDTQEHAARAVREHFNARFGARADEPACPTFAGLPDDEPPFSPDEVLHAVAELKGNKTTGISRVGVCVFKTLVQLHFGLQLLTDILNLCLRDCDTALPEHLAAGWVILLPKTAFPNEPAEFRPIVCGEVILKLLSKLAVRRVTACWSLPRSCFGACRGRGVMEALFLVKSCLQESSGLADGTVFLQLDVAQAFDSLRVSAVLQYMKENWSSTSARSAHILRWCLTHSSLRFEFLDAAWFGGASNRLARSKEPLTRQSCSVVSLRPVSTSLQLDGSFRARLLPSLLAHWGIGGCGSLMTPSPSSTQLPSFAGWFLA